MGRSSWFWKLQLLQWSGRGRALPFKRTLSVIIWWLPCVAIPLVLRVAGPGAAEAGQTFLLSVDVPLALALAGATALDASTAAAGAGSLDWLWPEGFRPARARWLSRVRWLAVARWPAGLAFASLLLASGGRTPLQMPAELLLIAGLGLASGGACAWALSRRATTERSERTPRPRRALGPAAVSWAALHAARERFDLHRAPILVIPAMLAAPAGATASAAGKMILLWLPLLFFAVVCREAVRVQGSLRRWLHGPVHLQLRLTWWVWRYVLLAIAIVTASSLWWAR